LILQAFTAVFTLECIIKIVALQKSYFTQPWNQFDLAMVFISFFDFSLGVAIGEDGGFNFRVFRLVSSAHSVSGLTFIPFYRSS